MKTVLVTGANGHIGYQVCKQLAQRGYQVKAMVRGLHRRNYQALQALPITLVEADCLMPQTLPAALEGCDGVFHLAAIFNNSANQIDEVVTPNINITNNILRAAAAAGIKRVVYTSSIAAIGTAPIGAAPLDNQHYNHQTPQLYARSKAISEQHAWQLADELGLNLATVLPGVVLGPFHDKPTDSIAFVEQLVNNKIPCALPSHLAYVDVRDLADAHIRVYESERQTRHVAVSHETDIKGLIQAVKQQRAIKASETVLPSWLCSALPLMDWLQHKITGSERTMTRTMVKEYINRQQRYQDKALQQQLDWPTRDFADTIAATLQSLDHHGYTTA